ncbi:hypothetical protein [Sulfuricaulis sp.]|jgi:hypothetical protein|uniref:hypothetical protein n=1 Tax=Sulfuricaulis sp. TaxID=2003553 RepID=UPI003559AB59
MKAESITRKLQLVVFLSALNTLAVMAMMGQAYSFDVDKASAKAPEKVSLIGNMDASINATDAVVLER